MNEGSSMSGTADDGQNLYQPEQVITPTAQPIPTEHAVHLQEQAVPIPAQPVNTSAPIPAQPVAAPMAAPQAPLPIVPAEPMAVTEVAATELDTQPSEETDLQPATSDIHWTASEFIANQKSIRWYIALGFAAALIGAFIWLLTRDFFPTSAVLVGVLLLGIYAGHKPRQEAYALDEHGITIGNRHYGYDEFRSFAVVPEGAFLSIEFAPLKRFALDTTIYVAPDDEDRILDYLSQYLPMEDAKSNFTDNLMRRIRF